MNAAVSASCKHLFVGLEGWNPLAFLAAVGTLRLLTESRPEWHPRMAWTMHAGAWRPLLYIDQAASPFRVVKALAKALQDAPTRKCIEAVRQKLSVGSIYQVPSDTWRKVCWDAAHGASLSEAEHLAWLAALASEPATDQEETQATLLQFMTGQGHQHFLDFMINIIDHTAPQHLEKCLFRRWTYEDPISGLTLRWDPANWADHALRDRDPSGDPSRQNSGNVLGANRLAIEALPLLPTGPVQGGAATRAFHIPGRGHPAFRWPIWKAPISLSTLASLLGCPWLTAEEPDRETLRRVGVVEVFQAARIPVDRYKIFTPGRPVAAAPGPPEMSEKYRRQVRGRQRGPSRTVAPGGS